MKLKTAISMLVTVNVLMIGGTGLAAPTVTLTPAQGPSGTQVQVHACGFNTVFLGQGDLRVRVGNIVVGTGHPVPCPDGSMGFGQGTSSPPVFAPINGSPGPVTVTVENLAINQTGSASFTITAVPKLSLTPAAKIESIEVRHAAITGGLDANTSPDLEANVRLALPNDPLFKLMIKNDAYAATNQRILDLLLKAFEKNSSVVLIHENPIKVIVGVQLVR